MVNFCSNCGQATKPNAKFCASCGKALVVAETAALNSTVIPHPTISAGSPLIVSQNGPGHYRTIMEAIHAASAGSRILIQPGLYTETILIDKTLEICGDGPTEQIVIEAEPPSDTLTMQAQRATVRNLTLRNTQPQPYANVVVNIEAGQLIMENCCIIAAGCGDGSTGIRIGIDAEPTIQRTVPTPIIRRCKISSEGEAVAIFAGLSILEDCQLFNSVSLRGGSEHILRRCEIQSPRNGITLRDTSAIVENTSIRNCDDGISIYGDVKAVIRDCSIQNCYNGIRISGSYNTIRVTLERCQLVKNTQNGFMDDFDRMERRISNTNHYILRNCRIMHNGNCGIVLGANADAVVEGCDLTSNRVGSDTPGSWKIHKDASVRSLNNNEVSVSLGAKLLYRGIGIRLTP